jgi:hypothetical protein
MEIMFLVVKSSRSVPIDNQEYLVTSMTYELPMRSHKVLGSGIAGIVSFAISNELLPVVWPKCAVQTL